MVTPSYFDQLLGFPSSGENREKNLIKVYIAKKYLSSIHKLELKLLSFIEKKQILLLQKK